MNLIGNPYSPWAPCPWHDPELERLRRLAERRQVELEKERLRRWLWRNGIPGPEVPFPAPRIPLPVEYPAHSHPSGVHP